MNTRREALQELVRLKKIKDKLAEIDDSACTPAELDAFDELESEYVACKPLAWAAAEAALAAQEAPASQQAAQPSNRRGIHMSKGDDRAAFERWMELPRPEGAWLAFQAGWSAAQERAAPINVAAQEPGIRACCQQFETCREMCNPRADYWQGQAEQLKRAATPIPLEPAAIQELRNIANAKRFDREHFDDDTQFADWVQSRARYMLARTIPLEPVAWLWFAYGEWKVAIAGVDPPPDEWKAEPLYAAPISVQPPSADAAGNALGDPQDVARFMWLTADHADPATRTKCREILNRMPVMSYSAACQAIDAAMGETHEQG